MAVFRVISGLAELRLGAIYILLVPISTSFLYYLLLFIISLSLPFFSFFCTPFIGFFCCNRRGFAGVAAAIPCNLCKNGIIMLKKHSKFLIITHARIFIKF